MSSAFARLFLKLIIFGNSLAAVLELPSLLGTIYDCSTTDNHLTFHLVSPRAQEHCQASPETADITTITALRETRYTSSSRSGSSQL
ncbi:hypothetical protein V8F33_004012 [Rhypophila sp. PSN 637]